MKRYIENHGFVVIAVVLTLGFFALIPIEEKHRSAFADLAKDVTSGYVAGVATNKTSGRRETK